MILTCNLTFGSWDQAFAGDPVLAAAMLNRLLHYSTVVSIQGESYRLKDNRRARLLKNASGRGIVKACLGGSPVLLTRQVDRSL